MSRKQQQANLAGFPMLLNTDISELLFHIGVPIHVEDLSKPTGATAQAIWSGLLGALMACPVEDLEGPKQAVLGMLPYRELYGDSLQFVMFYSQCRRLATLCGIKDFTMSDLTRPEPQRLRMILSGVMNFFKFREEFCRDYFLSLSEELNEKKDRASEMREQLATLEREIDEIKKKRAEDEPVLAQRRAENSEIHDELLQLRGEQMELSASVEQLKKERQSLKTEHASKEHELTVLQQQVAAMRARVVRSPERMKRNIAEMQAQVQAERARHAELVVKAHDHERRLGVFAGLETDLRELIELEKDIAEQMKKSEEAARKCAALKSGIQRNTILREGLAKKLSQLERKHHGLSERVGRQEEAKAQHEADAKAKVEELKEQYVALSKVRNLQEKERVHLVAQQKALDAEMETYKQEAELKLNSLLEDYWAMRKRAEEYMRTMTSELGLELR